MGMTMVVMRTGTLSPREITIRDAGRQVDPIESGRRSRRTRTLALAQCVVGRTERRIVAIVVALFVASQFLLRERISRTRKTRRESAYVT